MIEEHMKLLGLKVRDKVTQYEGVVTSMTFDLYGCIQAIVNPFVKDNKLEDSRYFDVARLDILDDEPVMEVPDFKSGYVAEGKKGPADKPAL